MDDLKEKLTYLSVATSQVLSGLQGEEGQAAAELLGPDLMKQFAEQTRLEDQYVQNSEREGAFPQEDNEEMGQDARLLQKNTLELCRKMKAVPNIVQELRNFQETRPAQVILFLKTLADMQDLTLKRLTTTVEEERSRQELLEYYKQREQEASQRKRQLEKDLNHMRKECEKAQSQRNEILTKLRADKFEVTVSQEKRMNDLRSRYEFRMTEQQETFQQKKNDMEKKINELKDKNSKLKAASQDEETEKQRLAKRYEKEVGDVIGRYDEKVRELVSQLGDTQEAYKLENRKLTDLKERFDKIDEEKECLRQEESIADARKAKLEAEKERRNAMAAMVQAYWRGILTREQYATMKKNKKKKGGGKKKK
jgi:chromosome segregation ATPase